MIQVQTSHKNNLFSLVAKILHSIVEKGHLQSLVNFYSKFTYFDQNFLLVYSIQFQISLFLACRQLLFFLLSIAVAVVEAQLSYPRTHLLYNNRLWRIIVLNRKQISILLLCQLSRLLVFWKSQVDSSLYWMSSFQVEGLTYQINRWLDHSMNL